MTERMDVNRLLMEMRAMKAQSQAFGGVGSLASRDVPSGLNPTSNAAENVNGPKFTELMTKAIDKVNEIQHASSATSKAYVQGDPNVDITDVMVASQKSGIAFDSMLQVRNKMVEAYREVMNMPI